MSRSTYDKAGVRGSGEKGWRAADGIRLEKKNETAKPCPD